MDCQKVGSLLRSLRVAAGMTQLEVADRLGVSDKAISKWERALGCPDISLLSQLADVFGVSVESILQGEMSPNDTNGGNMKRVKFFVCPECASIFTGTGEAEVTCCGRKLQALKAKKEDDDHVLTAQAIEDDWYVTSTHEMKKEHYISFAALLSYDRMLLIKQYPEQNCEIRFPRRGSGTLVWYCSRHGLFEKKL